MRPLLPPPAIGDPYVPMPPPERPADAAVGDAGRRPPAGSRRHRTTWMMSVVAAAFAAGVLGVVVGARITDDGPTYSVADPSAPVVVATSRDGVPDRGLDVAAVSAALAPSVVAVSSDITSGTEQGEGVGTGVVLTAGGQILTNAHVIDGATKVRVRLNGERDPRSARVVAADAGNDLAILQVDVSSANPATLTPATLAAAGSTRVGDEVVAIGFALDLDGDASVTLGIVSALNRTLLTDTGALDGLIQTDAAISSGNSGGPLVNEAGEVVGINTALARGDAQNAASNVGFAISIDQVLPEIDVLRATADGEEFASGFLGVQLGERTDGGRGATIVDVVPGSPADDAGIATGDVVVEVDGEQVDGSGGAIGAIRDNHPGDEVTVVVERDGEKKSFDVTLTDRPPEAG